MADALFERDGDQVVPTSLCAGPWDQAAMHGGAPTVLCGRFIAGHGDGDAYHLARLTVELIRPVPLRPLTVEVSETRPGRRIQLLDAVVRDPDGVEVVYARGMRIQRSDNGLDEAAAPTVTAPVLRSPEDSPVFEHTYPYGPNGFYMDAFDIRLADERAFGPLGPAAAWFRLNVPAFAGAVITPLDRVLAISDFGNGVSNNVDMNEHLYINPDLTVNLHRLPEGEWVANDAHTHVRAGGYGTATGRLADRQGTIGIANQSLLVTAR